MAASSAVLAKYGTDTQDQKEQVIHLAMQKFKPEWWKYAATKGCAEELGKLKSGMSPEQIKEVISGDKDMLFHCMKAVSILKGEGGEEKPVLLILTILYDALREDSSLYMCFEDALKRDSDVIYTSLHGVVSKFADAKPNNAQSVYVRDQAAWLLSAIMGNLPQYFVGGNQSYSVCFDFLGNLLRSSEDAGTDAAVGTLEAIGNLLKSDALRTLVWNTEGVPEHIFGVQKSAQSHSLYRCVFAIWMLSYDASISDDLKKHKVVARMKEIIMTSRVEKVVRLSLTVFKSLLGYKTHCEDIVELNVLEAVQALEYEKWRDTELYDEIRDMSQLISVQVSEISNFERYERDLNNGKLTWGFTHTSKFFGENVMKFENNDFQAVKMLAKLLHSEETDPETLAVACHDVGEFVALHPLGKKKVNQLGVKERVMGLMGKEHEEMREVRREALLCCQKIMLNKWQDIEKAK